MSSPANARSRLAALMFAAVLVAGFAPLASPPGVAAVTLPAPTLKAPAIDASVGSNPVFTWTAVPGAAKYRLEVSTSEAFSSQVGGFPVTTLNLRYAPPAELPVATMYWRVAALDASNAVGTFAFGRFTKSIGAAPTIVSPTDGSELVFPTDPLLFRWTALAGAASYELQVDDANDFVGATTYSTKNTSYVITEPKTVDQTFYWRVRGNLGSLYSDWSSPNAFHSTWPHVPTLVYPAAGATEVTDVYFDWNPVPGAANYQLQVGLNPDWQNNITINVTVKSTRYEPPIPLNNGNYYWRVRAIDAAGSANFGAWTDKENVSGDERVFQRAWRIPSDTAYLSHVPKYVWPPDGGSSADQDNADDTWENPSFTWTPVRNASWYRLRFSETLDPVTGFLSGTIQGCLTNRTTWTPYTAGSGTALIVPGSCDVTLITGHTYYWDVAGLDDPVMNPSAFDLWGPPTQTSSVLGIRSGNNYPGCEVKACPWSFTYEPPTVPSQGTVAPLAPTDYLTPDRCDPLAACDVAVADTPVFTWNAIPGATGYLVTVSLDPNFTNTYRRYTTPYNRLAPRDSWRDNQASQAYYWNVTPLGGAIELDPTNRSVFQKRTEGVHRTSPANAAEVANDFTMSWEDYLKTNQSLTPAIPQEARKYQIQTSTVSDFASTLESRVVNTPFYTPSGVTYPEGPVYWRVQAVDGSENLLTVSLAGGGFVTKKSGSPVQKQPADGGQVLGVPTLQWNPQPYAASYAVQIDNDANFSSPIATVTTKMTAWTYTEPLAVGTYYWRVRRNDAGGREGAWSDAAPSHAWTFVLNPAAPTLVSPINGAAPAPANLLLTWSSAQAYPKYSVDLSTSSQFLGQVTGFPQTTVMTSWAPMTLLANGTYYWRVRALNASGATVATSSTLHFTVDSSRPSVTIGPASAASITTAFTATFSEAVKWVNSTNFKVTIAGTSTAVAGTIVVLSPTQARFTPSAILVPGQTYNVTLSSSITDTGGNPLLPYSANIRTSTTVQENSPVVREGWGRWTTASASGGSMKLSRKVSSTLTYTFAGTSVALVGYRGTQGGYASVYLDGVLQTGSLSFYASSSKYKATLWSKGGLAAGLHTLRVVPKGTKPAASKGTWVYVDAFIVNGTTTVQDNGVGVVDRFRRVSTASASGSAYDQTDFLAATGRSGPALSFQFKGTAISWYGTKGAASGKAYVYIDGSRKATIDLYRSATAYKQRLWTSAPLSNAVHTIKIVVVGSKRSTAKGYDVSFDSFAIK
ncbi:MAG TPA: Ig-like domain-containing protein [Armatimonadota bacterium]|jgi:hypothetical protein